MKDGPGGTSKSAPAPAPASAAKSGRTSVVGAVGLVVALAGGLALIPQLFHHAAPDAPEVAVDVIVNGAQLPGNPAHLRLSDLRGNAVLLDFWASWCGPCRLEAPIVDRIAKRWHDRGVVVVGVDEDDPSTGDGRAYAVAEGLSYAIAQDNRGQVMQQFGADALPTLVVISRAGKVAAVRTGVTDDSDLEHLLTEATRAPVPGAMGL